MPTVTYLNVTDGRTDGRTTYDSNTALALRASRCKNYKKTPTSSKMERSSAEFIRT